jgi:putative transposase
MSRSGNVWDNAVMETFLSTLKTERRHRATYLTRDAARADVFNYIERVYNLTLKYSVLGYQSSVDFERIKAVAQLAVHGTRRRSEITKFPSRVKIPIAGCY